MTEGPATLAARVPLRTNIPAPENQIQLLERYLQFHLPIVAATPIPVK